jgi:predicted transposase/invertase (TIGR01784 family)
MRKKKIGWYMNLKTDYAFKSIFANRHYKEILINLLNAVLGGENAVIDVEYLLPEQLGKTIKERRAIFDIHCTNSKKEKFIIEMQVAEQKHFMDRCLYYATFPIRKQAKKGKWDYELKPLYIITILDFEIWKDNDKCINRHSLMNEETYRIINDKLKIITAELPKFSKKLNELKTDLDKWMFCFRHLHELMNQPEELSGKIFDKLFELANINNLNSEDMDVYEKSLAEYNDIRLMMECSHDKGFEAGIERGREGGIKATARNLRNMGFSLNDIVQATGLTLEQIRQIK